MGKHYEQAYQEYVKDGKNPDLMAGTKVYRKALLLAMQELAPEEWDQRGNEMAEEFARLDYFKGWGVNDAIVRFKL